MIPSTEVNHATVGRHAASLQMGIDPSAFKHLMGILTNLYSNKVLAVIREYCTNAYDSHVAAFCPDRPIQVTLPVKGSRTPVFRVQDFGTGLSFEELRDVYAQYGASSKRNSNDVNGMLGLGCKSALTYSTSFTITSIKDGRKVMAVISKDSEGLGAIKVLADLPTEEANGVTIEIPVVADGVHTFRETAFEFFRSWRPGTVFIDGKDPAGDPDHKYGFFYRNHPDGEDHVWLTPDILVSRNSGYGAKSFIVMGNVAYPHDFGVSGCTVRAWVPIGDVDFVPAREALHYTERTNSTVKRIKAEFANLAKRIGEVAGKGTTFEKNNVIYQWAESVSILRNQKPTVKSDPLLTFKVQGDYATRYKHGQVNWREFQGHWQLVTGFPFKSVGPTHKRRLIEKFGGTGVLLFPPSTDLSAVAGHPRLTTWDDVVKTTSKPIPKKREKTLYTARKGDQEKTAEKFGTGSTVYYHVYSTNRWGGGPTYDDRAPEIWQVALKSSQVDRFVKLHPLSKPVKAYIDAEYRAAEAALTDDDKLAAAVQRGYMPGPFTDANFVKAAPLLHDPLLRRVIGLQTYTSATLTRAGNLGVSIPDQDKIIEEINTRYPLLSGYSSCTMGNYYKRVNITEEIVLYLNAKYDHLTANGKQA